MTTSTFDHEKLRANLCSPRHWVRLVYMLVFAMLLHLASAVMWVLCTLQFLITVATGNDNANLRRLGKSITEYIRQCLAYLSYNTDDKPFPFSIWPCSKHTDGGDNVRTDVAESGSGVVLDAEPEKDEPESR